MNRNRKSGKSGRMSRRKFINLTAAGSAAFITMPAHGFGPAQSGVWPEDATQFRFHMIGHAHIDPVWLWPWTEGLSVVHSTFRSNLDRLKETPEACFVSSSAQFYQWIADNDPVMLAEIRKRVEEGKWNVVGGWWVEPDVNMPSGEAMVRQGLYGQLTLQRLLGRKATVAFNPDSFGHTGTLPQIITLQGMRNYVFMRPGQNEKEIPSDLFWWEGPDGSRVLTYRIQISYNDSASVRTRLEKIMSQSQGQPIKTFMAFYGAGDHGGGATIENLRSINEIRSEQGAPVVYFSTPEKYFEEIRNDRTLDLPVVKDDLQHHAPGCYTAESAIKKSNRKAEAALCVAEKIAAAGSRIWGANYPAEEITSAWKQVLLLQFHDSLAGSSLYEHSQTASEGFGYALNLANKVAYTSLQTLEWQVPAEDPASQYLLVFNPHAWEITSIIAYDFNWGTNNKNSRVEDEAGKSLHHQWTAASTETGSRKKLLVKTTIPAFGYRQVRLLEGDSEPVMNPVKVTTGSLENGLLKLEITPGGIQLFDKSSGKNIFSGKEGGCLALVIDDPSDTWSHDIKSFSKVIGSFRNNAIKILESGPLRSSLRSISKYGDSTLTIDWSLCAGSDQVEAEVQLDWKEHLKMLKLSFPVDVQSPVTTYETPYGFIERATNGDEDPGQRWIDLTGARENMNYGLTVLNNAKYGYSVHGNDMRISVVRSAVYAHHNPRVLDNQAEHLWMDQGIQKFRLLLVPHKGSWKERNIPRIAEEFLSPALSIYQGIHGGTMKKSDSFISVDSPAIIVSAVKQSEIGKDLIIRCVEMSGAAVETSLELGFMKKKVDLEFRPDEFKTLRISNKTGEITEVNLLEE
ncbi:MAG TPA: glycoside hydrolase family 38 C-terminal domain-containing protein [Bacteroidales bacterium]|nr:glycoside hydrolase family 38 C-terminal domain-containing protein [Bacteroidales bacterium]